MKKMDKKTIFYTATKVGKNRNLELFSKQVVDLLMPGVESISFHTTEAVFDFIDVFGEAEKKFALFNIIIFTFPKRDVSPIFSIFNL